MQPTPCLSAKYYLRRPQVFGSTSSAIGSECARASGASADSVLFQGMPAPGDEIVPSMEPLVKLVAKLNERVTMKLPVASANRPVPPVMVAVSTMEKTTGPL